MELSRECHNSSRVRGKNETFVESHEKKLPTKQRNGVEKSEMENQQKSSLEQKAQRRQSAEKFPKV